MRSLICPLILLFAFASCKSKKDVIVEKAVEIDSIARSEQHRTFIEIDSLFRNIDFSFDTLKVNIERPVLYSDVPEKVRITAVRGNVKDNSRLHRNIIEQYNHEDTVAFKQSSQEASEEHSATTRVYNPPNTTAFCIVCVGIFFLFLFLYLHFKK